MQYFLSCIKRIYHTLGHKFLIDVLKSLSWFTNPESDDKYVYNLICCGFLRYDMKERRSIRPVTKERYDTLSQLTNDTFRVPVKDRTIEQRRAVLQFYRAKDQFSVRDGLLYRLDKKVLLSSDIEQVVKQSFDKIQGCGSRALKIVI